jgi:hypothetical protein
MGNSIVEIIERGQRDGNCHRIFTFNYRHTFYSQRQYSSDHKKVFLSLLAIFIYGVVMPSSTQAQSQPSFQTAQSEAHAATLPSNPQPLQPSAAQQILSSVSSKALGFGRDACVSKPFDGDLAYVHRHGWPGNPRSGEDCLATLIRLARDGQIYELYKDFMELETSSPDGYEELPAQMLYVAMKTDENSVAVGEGTGIGTGERGSVGVGRRQALDAGFTIGWNLPNPPQISTDAATLDGATDACFQQGGDPLTGRSICAKVGLQQGVRHRAAQRLLSSR